MCKHILLFLFFLFLLFIAPLNGQRLDSIKYVNFYHQHSNSYEYGDTLDMRAKIAGLSKAWAEARFNFSNFDQIPTVNWDSLYLGYLHKVMEANSKVDYYKILTRFYTHLQDGHSMIVAPFEIWDSLYAALPIVAKLIENEVVISKNHSTDKVYSKLKKGTVIKKINGVNIHDYVSKNITPYVSFTSAADSISRIYSYHFTRGNINEVIELDLISPDGETFTESFKRIPQHQINNLIKNPEITLSSLSDRISLLSIPGFSQQNQSVFLDSIFNEIKTAEALIIDLRGNNSGLLFNAYELLSYLHLEPYTAETILSPVYYPFKRARQLPSYDIEIQTNVRQPYWGLNFVGPIAVLIDNQTHGNAEVFLASLEQRDNIHIFGAATSGASGQAIVFRLPGNGTGYVSSSRNLMVDQKEYYRVGIQADFEIKPSLNQIITGEDPVLEAAIKFLSKK